MRMLTHYCPFVIISEAEVRKFLRLFCNVAKEEHVLGT